MLRAELRVDEPGPETRSQARQAAKVAWAKMIRKVYEVDPLACPECASQMRVIALIEDPAVIKRILSWLGTRRSPADLHRLASTRAFRSPTIPSPTSPKASLKQRS